MGKKNLSIRATIILILLVNDKIVMSLSQKDQDLWPVYVIRSNLDGKMCQGQNRPGTLLLGLIPILYKQIKN